MHTHAHTSSSLSFCKIMNYFKSIPYNMTQLPSIKVWGVNEFLVLDCFLIIFCAQNAFRNLFYFVLCSLFRMNNSLSTRLVHEQIRVTKPTLEYISVGM